MALVTSIALRMIPVLRRHWLFFHHKRLHTSIARHPRSTADRRFARAGWPPPPPPLPPLLLLLLLLLPQLLPLLLLLVDHVADAHTHQPNAHDGEGCDVNARVVVTLLRVRWLSCLNVGFDGYRNKKNKQKTLLNTLHSLHDGQATKTAVVFKRASGTTLLSNITPNILWQDDWYLQLLLYRPTTN